MPLLQTELGLVIALIQIEMPLMLLPLLSVMHRIDRNLVDASRSLGASHWRTFFQVLLPLSVPGSIAGRHAGLRQRDHGLHLAVHDRRRPARLPAVLIWQQAMVDLTTGRSPPWRR